MLRFKRKGGDLVYENVKAFADARNMSIHALEKEAGLTNGTIGKWRTCSPTLKNLQAVAKVLGVTVQELVEE